MKITFDLPPIIHFNCGRRSYACNPNCNTNSDRLTKDKKLVTCKSCLAYLKRKAPKLSAIKTRQNIKRLEWEMK